MSARKNKMHVAVKILLPLLILAVGVAGFMMLGKLKKAPRRQAAPQQGVLVDVMTVAPQDHQIRVFATGTVSPAKEINLVPQVSGKVSWVSPRLVTGGFFKKGETLLEIEAADFRLAVEQARAEVAQARVALETEKEQARVARAEWDRIQLPDKGKPGPLVTREIQLRQQEAALAAAEATLNIARLNLQRTTITAPFNCRISSEQVDIGQYVTSGSVIASLAGTDRAEIRVPLPSQDLQWIEIPKAGEQEGSPVIISAPGDNSPQWQGTIVRQFGEIDPDSRMATVVVAVNDPYQLSGSRQLPDLPHGLFVETVMLGQTLDNVIAIPRKALRTGEVIWLAGDDNRLHIRPVNILRREKDQVIIEGTIADDERLILTTLSGAAEGTRLRPVNWEPLQ